MASYRAARLTLDPWPSHFRYDWKFDAYYDVRFTRC